MKIPKLIINETGHLTNATEIQLWATENNITFRAVLSMSSKSNLSYSNYAALMIASLLHANEALLDAMQFQATGTPRTDHHRSTAMANYLSEKAVKEATTNSPSQLELPTTGT